MIKCHSVEIGRQFGERPPEHDDMQRVTEDGVMNIEREEVTGVADLANTAGGVVVRAGNVCGAEQQHSDQRQCDEAYRFGMPLTHS